MGQFKKVEPSGEAFIIGGGGVEKNTVDVRIINQGSMVGFVPITTAAQAWFDEHVHSEGWQWLGNALWVDHRYARDLTAGLADAGMELRS
jgi:hypothetical protein